VSLSPEQIQFYRDEGYILLENIIAPNNLVRVREKISEYLERSREVSASNALFDLDPGHSAVTPMVRRLKDPHRVDPLFADLCRCDEILDPVADLLGGTVRFDHSKLNFKPAHSNAAIQWHQDWGFYPHTNDDLLAVGVMIEDCTHDNGPLMVIPGSHRGPIYNHHHDGIFAGGIDPNDIESELDKAVEIVGPAGSISIHHVRTLHGSENNTTGSIRPLMLFSYMAVDAFPILERYEIEEFDSRILRGQPTLVGRMESLPFRIAQPRQAEADSIYDDQAAMKK
jgi:ectoine hydroxylase-related dioxygenase (phytanoyl-CoA dioxygenase family)